MRSLLADCVEALDILDAAMPDAISISESDGFPLWLTTAYDPCNYFETDEG